MYKNKIQKIFYNSYKVKIIPLVGNFKPGLVDVDGQIVPPEIDDTFIVFLKLIFVIYKKSLIAVPISMRIKDAPLLILNVLSGGEQKKKKS